MVRQVQLSLNLFSALLKGLKEDKQYSLDLKPSKENIKEFTPGNVIRVLECTEEEFHPIKTPKGEPTHHKRILHHPTGREVRLKVIALEPSSSQGYLKATFVEEE